MAEQADALEREDEVEEHELEPVEPVEGEETETEPNEDEPVEGDEPEDELEISFGDEAAPASRGESSDLVRDLRARVREQANEIATLRRSGTAPQPQKIEVGAKPTLESCGYDEGRFETELDAWKERKRQADDAQRRATEQTQAEQQRFGKKLEAFGNGKTALKVRDFDAAEEAVVSTLSQVQQAIVIEAADDSAKLIYALGRHPEKLKTLSAITNPIEFTKALVKLEGQLKVTSSRRTPPDPDRPVRGSAPIAARTDKTLERLEREAERTGDRTKIRQYRQEQRARAQGK